MSAADDVFLLRCQLADTPSAQIQLAINEDMPFWMKFGGEPKLSYDADPCRRLYMLSDVHNLLTKPGTWWRWKVDTDCGREMQFVRR